MGPGGIAVAAAAVVGLVEGAVALDWLNFWDEGVLWSGTERLLAGEWPQRDFQAYAPGRYLLVAALVRAGVPLIAAARAVGVAAAAVIAGLAAALYWRLAAAAGGWRRAAGLAVLIGMLLAAPGVYYERFVTVSLLGVAVAVTARRGRGFWVPLAMVAAILLRTEAVAPALVALAADLLARRGAARHGSDGTVLVTAAIVALAGVGVLATVSAGGARSPGAQHGIAHLVQLLLAGHASWSIPLLGAAPAGYESVAWLPVRALEPGLIIAMVATPVGVVVARLRGGRESSARGDGARLFTDDLLALAALGACALPVVLWRAGIGNAVRLLPLFLPVWLGLWSHISARRFAVDAAGAILVAGHLVLYTGMFPETVQSPLLRFLHPLVPYDVRGSRLYVHPWHRAVGRAVVQTIQEWVPPRERIAVFPFHPIWFSLAERRNATSFEWFLPPDAARTGAEERLRDELLAAPPAVVIAGTTEIDGLPERRFDRYAPRVAELLRRDYARLGRVDELWILARRAAHAGRRPLVHELTEGTAEAAGLVQIAEEDEEGWPGPVLWLERAARIAFSTSTADGGAPADSCVLLLTASVSLWKTPAERAYGTVRLWLEATAADGAEGERFSSRAVALANPVAELPVRVRVPAAARVGGNFSLRWWVERNGFPIAENVWLRLREPALDCAGGDRRDGGSRE